MYKGCNLAGGGTDWTKWGSAGPVSGTNYLFVSHADIDLLVAKGMNTFRLLFAWEALQAKEYEAIGLTYGAYAATVFDLVDYITKTKGCVCILDIHGDNDAGFAAYRGVHVGSRTASGQLVDDLLENLWWQISKKYATNTKVWVGVVNEPHDLTPAVWYAAAQRVIDGWRSGGSTAPIIMPGTAWTGAGTWVSSGDAAGWNLVDPLQNLHVQLHLYFDTNSGGNTTDVVSATIGTDRLKDAIAWARGKKLKIFLGEVGLSASAVNGKPAWGDLVTTMETNSDVVLGWTWWAQGPPKWWGNYQFTLFDTTGAETAQMTMLATTLAAAPAPAPVPVDQSAQISALQAQIVTLNAQVATLTTTNKILLAAVQSIRIALVGLP